MSLIYPSYWAALKCRSKLSAASTASKFSQRPQPRRLRPLADPQEPTFAAAYLNLDVLKSMFYFFSFFYFFKTKNRNWIIPAALSMLLSRKTVLHPGLFLSFRGPVIELTNLNPLHGVFNWLWNSLNLILMPLYDLHKKTRPTARGVTISLYLYVVILNACHGPITRKIRQAACPGR